MLILASKSPRRAALLAAAGIPFETLAVDIDESPLRGERPEAHVRRVAEQKARAAASKRRDAIVLAGDTIVVIDDRILGKPKDAAEAREMLRALSGRPHEVLTGVAIIAPGAGAGLPPSLKLRRTRKVRHSGRTDTPVLARRDGASPPQAIVEVASTQVWFSPLGLHEIEWYVASGEPMDKAGAYAIQGLASRFVERIEGSYSNVVGLPVALVYRLLQAVS